MVDKELRELRMKKAKSAIEDLREVADNLYVYDFLEDMLFTVQKAIIENGDVIYISDYYEDSLIRPEKPQLKFELDLERWKGW